MQEVLRRVVPEEEDVFYSPPPHNKNYPPPAMPEGAEAGIVKGMYLLKAADPKAKGHRVHLLGCGAILREIVAGAELLAKDFGINADVWSVTSFTELARDAAECERGNLLHPLEAPRVPYVTQALKARDADAPVIASTDYMKMFAEQIRPHVGRSYRVLGTDGFGRSDYRKKLRYHFEVDRHFVVAAALKSLADENKVPSVKVAEAIEKYGIDPEKASPAKA